MHMCGVACAGVVLWELLTGQTPWEDLNPMQVVGAVGFARKGLPAPPREGNDPFLVDLCNACRAHEPSARPSFREVVQVRRQRPGSLRTATHAHLAPW